MRELTEKNVVEQEIKKSRFIAAAVPVSTPEEAAEAVSALGDPEATHNCWAYRIGDEYRFSDDGEPGGTAGRPILAAIEKQSMDRCLVVVTRYFGGIKLGAGGLVRAYSGAAAACLRSASTQEIRTYLSLRFSVPFDCIGDVYGVLKTHDAVKDAERFDAAGAVLSVTVEEQTAPHFQSSLIEATRGRAVFEEV